MNKILYILLIILIQNRIMTPKEIYVGKSFEVKTLGHAIRISNPNDIIILKEGVYYEHDLVVDKPLTITSSENAILDGEGKYQILTVSSDSVIVEGITFMNCGISFVNDNAAIKIDSSSGCIIRNNEFVDNFFSIYLAKSQYCKIYNNKITASNNRESYSGNGIHLWYSKKVDIFDNNITGHRDGIYLEFVRASKIYNNVSKYNLRYGLHFMFSDSCSYFRNTFSKNGAGVAVMYTKNVIMTENKFIENWGSASYGILLKEISDSEIRDNYFFRNSSGIYLEGSNRLNIKENKFKENGWAIRLMANSMDNTITLNNFIGNSFDLTTNSVKNYNKIYKNYWDDYRGYDLNKDGFGDIPHHPVKLFSLIVEKNRPALILLRSFFIDILNLAESLFPVLTPELLVDQSPLMNKYDKS